MPTGSPSRATIAPQLGDGSDELGPVTANGRTLPPDLPALLDGLHTPGRSPVQWLIRNFGVADTRSLLEIPADKWKLIGAKDAAAVNALRRHLRGRWAVDFGALAEAEPEAPKPPVLVYTEPEPGSPRQPDEPLSSWVRREDREKAAGIRDWKGNVIPVELRRTA